jgi:hypothetical protein
MKEEKKQKTKKLREEVFNFKNYYIDVNSFLHLTNLI